MRRLTVLACVCAGLAGCGGADGDESARSVTVPAGDTLRVVADEYSFDPRKVEVEGAGPLRIRLRNAGNLAHNLRLMRDGRDVGGTPTFPGGRTESGRVHLEPGDYELVCTVADHAELGMHGTLQVE